MRKLSFFYLLCVGLFFILSTPSLFAYIISVTRWKHNDINTIIPIGDYLLKNDIDAQQWGALRSVLKKWSKETGLTSFIIGESLDVDAAKHGLMVDQNNITMLDYLLLFASKHNWRYGSVVFRPVDYREKIFYDSIGSFVYGAQEVLQALNEHFIPTAGMNQYQIKNAYDYFEPAILLAIDQWMADHPDAWNDFEKFKLTLMNLFEPQARNVLKSDVVHHYKAKRDVAHQFFQKYSSLKRYDDKMMENSAKALKMLEQYPDNMSLLEIFISRYNTYKSFKMAYSEIWNLFVIPYVLIADAGFLTEVINELPFYDRIVLYLGGDHAYNLNQMIADMTNAHEISFNIISSQDDKNKPIDPAIIENLLNGSLNERKKPQYQKKSEMMIFFSETTQQN